ncbi:hypothetical protein H074_30797 [Amycolatopsis decaplanina DSM 44594]|uniref:Uncharacterized protein n=1 Tax=Amycolatopsis decaplanina DSM 44594 TaxID=1284240 RepID=M2XUA5_9PSEU|nr:hypothetical protein H074_30797 [Amycolatopsis decaplanina DSM 44594]
MRTGSARRRPRGRLGHRTGDDDGFALLRDVAGVGEVDGLRFGGNVGEGNGLPAMEGGQRMGREDGYRVFLRGSAVPVGNGRRDEGEDKQDQEEEDGTVP